LKKSKADRDLFNLVPRFEKSSLTKTAGKGPQKNDEPQTNLFQLNKKRALSPIVSFWQFFVRQAKAKNQLFIIGGILLLVILATSGLVSYQKRSAAAKRTQIEQAYQSLKTKVESAIKANELGDTKKAQSLLTEAQTDANNFPSSSYLFWICKKRSATPWKKYLIFSALIL